MKNEYEVRGDVTAIFLNSRKYGRMETLIATSDLERANEFQGAWYPFYNNTSDTFYARGSFRKADGKQKGEFLHRWILGVSDPKKQVDHVLHDTLDNCRWSLNIVTSLENNQNARMYSNNSSGYTGVTWHKMGKRWEAHININKKQKHLGLYDDINDAIAARKEAERTYYEYRANL